MYMGGYARFILVFLCFGFLSSVIYRYQSILKAEVSDAFLCIKFWLALYVGKKIFAKIDMQKYASKIFFHVKCITILYGVLIVIDYSLHIFQATERYGLRSEQLMYTHPTVLVACNRKQEIYNNTIAHNVFYFKKQSFWSRTCNHINMLFCVCSKEKNNAENNVTIYSFGCDFRMGSNTILFF